MRYATAAAFRMALEARLSKRSQETGFSLGRLRKQVVFERILARLLLVAPDRWVLKGGFALDLRLGDRARATKDVDLSRLDDVEQATRDMIAAQSIDPGDFFQLAVEKTDALDTILEGAAVRFRVSAALAGRHFEQVVVDIGFGDPFLRQPDMVAGYGLLEFVDVQSPLVPTIPVVQHLAEKVHAYTRAYGKSGRPSTRVKDLIDLVLIGSFERFEAGELQYALEQTFRARATHSLPDSLPAPPEDWRVPYAKLAEDVSLDRDISKAYLLALAILDPVLSGTVADDAVWDPGRGVWQTIDENQSSTRVGQIETIDAEARRTMPSPALPVPFPEDPYVLMLGQVAYAISYLEWTILGDLPRLPNLPEQMTLAALAGQSTGQIGRCLTDSNNLASVSDPVVREWLRVGGEHLMAVATKGDSILQARPATVGGQQRLYRWTATESYPVSKQMLREVLADIEKRVRDMSHRRIIRT